MKKQVAVFCLLVFCMSVLVACGNSNELRLLSEFGVTLPKDMALRKMTRIYDANNQGWMGDGDHYAVFKLKQAPSAIPTDFTEPSIQELGEGRVKTIVGASINELGAPAEYRPDWNQTYYWKFVGKHLLISAAENAPFDMYDDELYLIYQPHSLHLFLLARFI